MADDQPGNPWTGLGADLPALDRFAATGGLPERLDESLAVRPYTEHLREVALEVVAEPGTVQQSRIGVFSSGL